MARKKGRLTMAEKEYIEREALIKACKKIIHDRWNETTAPVSWSHAYADFIDDIEEQPVADVIPVVRCKDCKYYDKEYHQCKLHSEEPDQYSTGFIFNMQEDDFCSYGERRE